MDQDMPVTQSGGSDQAPAMRDGKPMGLISRAKQAVGQTRVKAEQVRQQGQTKLAGIKESHQESALYRSYGEAVYANLRRGGDHASVDSSLAALDEHFASKATDSQ